MNIKLRINVMSVVSGLIPFISEFRYTNNATHYPLNCSISDRRQNPVEFQLVTYFYVILLGSCKFNFCLF